MWVTNVTGHPKIPAVSSSAVRIHGYEDLSQMDFNVHGITHYCTVILLGSVSVCIENLHEKHLPEHTALNPVSHDAMRQTLHCNGVKKTAIR